MALVVPAVLPSSRADLEEKLNLLARVPAVSRVQIDVVDGRFATPACWPYTAPGDLKKLGTLPHLDRFEYEIDLMCLDAGRAAEDWLALGATRLTFHAESATNLPWLLEDARDRYSAIAPDVSVGIALNLSTDLALIESVIGEVSYVQFMGIATIGRQGQPFDRRVLERVRTFRSRYPHLPVQVDGGVSLTEAKELVALGVSNVIAGSAILRAKDPAALIAEFDALTSPHRA